MTTRTKKRSTKYCLQKPNGTLGPRVQAVGPERFGVLAVDCAKARSRWMLANFYGKVLIPPTTVEHAAGPLRAMIDLVRLARDEHQLRDLVVAIERTGEYHRPLQRACQRAGFETRLVHPFTSKQFRQPADPGNKTDDTDLAAIFRATVNGFGLIEPTLPDEYQQLQLLVRQRRDLVEKASAVCCQIRELLHALMPGYATCFSHLWESEVALLLARRVGSAEPLHALDPAGLIRLLADEGVRLRCDSAAKILAWSRTAAGAPPHVELRRQMLIDLDDDRLAKNRLISRLERQMARLLVRTPYVILLVIPGLHVVSSADLAGEAGPIEFYLSANAITGRSGLAPSRYQSDQVDRANGPLRRRANRRLRAALMRIGDNLIHNNRYFQGKALMWRDQARDPRWMRVKVVKTFSRLMYAMVAGRQEFPHPCRQGDHYVLRKLLDFHREHATPPDEVLADLEAALDHLPRSTHAVEALGLEQCLSASRPCKGPQPLADFLPLVLARLRRGSLQSESSEDRAPG